VTRSALSDAPLFLLERGSEGSLLSSHPLLHFTTLSFFNALHFFLSTFSREPLLYGRLQLLVRRGLI